MFLKTIATFKKNFFTSYLIHKWSGLHALWFQLFDILWKAKQLKDQWLPRFEVRESWIHGAQGNFREVKIIWYYNDKHVIICLSKLLECSMPSVKFKVSHGLWVIIKCLCTFMIVTNVSLWRVMLIMGGLSMDVWG